MAKARDSLGVQRRWSILERCDFTCAFCGSRPGNEHLHVDHLIPHSQGGSDHDNNLVAACDRCNLGKAARVSIPSKMLDGFVGRDGMRTWKRWGSWHLMFDQDVAVLTYDPDGRDYWIPLNRIHEGNWHEHLEWKPWMHDDFEAKRDAERAAVRDNEPIWTKPCDWLFGPEDAVDVDDRRARGERWLNFCDAIDFCRTLIRPKAARR